MESVDVTLEDHYTGDEINATVNAGGAFSDAFPGETRGELDALRALFQRKALLARQARLLEVPAARPRRAAGPDADARARAAPGAGDRRVRRRRALRHR